MKQILVSIMLVLLVNSACAKDIMDREAVIEFNRLPQTAQKFLNDNFPDGGILSIVMDNEVLERDYSVYYQDGTEVKFNGKGEWESVENESSYVPDSVVPEAILKMIRSKHPDKVVTNISRDLTGRDKGYDVELSNIMEMKFDMEGRFIRYDD